MLHSNIFDFIHILKKNCPTWWCCLYGGGLKRPGTVRSKNAFANSSLTAAMNQRQFRYRHREILCTLSLHSHRDLSKNVPWRWLSLAIRIHRRGKLIVETTVCKQKNKNDSVFNKSFLDSFSFFTNLHKY